MNHLTKQFIEKFEQENPDFSHHYCQVSDLYDTDLDIFHIEEVQDAYIEFKQEVKA